PNRVYAAVKFILYTLTGSLLMLVAILFVYFQHGAATSTYTFDLPVLVGFVIPGGLTQDLLFLAFALAFAIKVPMFPFHTWLPDAHVEAPTAGSVILAGVLLKMGTYGFLRFCLPLFPQASMTWAPWLFALSIIGIIYGAWISTVQADIKKLVAYSSVSHLGFVVLGLFTLTPQGMVGGIIQMVNHGLSTGALFLMVGMIYERRHTRLIADFGGLWKVIPAFSVLFLIVCLSSLGLPGLNGFVGEFLILLGTFQVHRLAAVLATSGIIFAAVYLLWMYQRVCFGELTSEANRRLRDLSPREWAVLLPVLLFIVWIGVYPTTFTAMTEPSVQALITQVQAKAQATSALLIPRGGRDPAADPARRRPAAPLAHAGDRADRHRRPAARPDPAAGAEGPPGLRERAGGGGGPGGDLLDDLRGGGGAAGLPGHGGARRLRPLLQHRDRLRHRPHAAALDGLHPPRGPGVGRVLRPGAALGPGHDADGGGGRSHHRLPRPRDDVDLALRAGRFLPHAPGRGRGLPEVPADRSLRLRVLPLRDRPDLRGHRHHQPRPHRQRGGGGERARSDAGHRARAAAGGLRLQDLL